ncbi:hypothetical protein [Catenuloplanes japonicus]|uniref:hypothetical protein n=1 Tax=Catenuloplanes japonicus TaxID=33876 RepID=UPI00052760D8|nr:hypothetical protein [Catenuloplanes japonicus]
MRISADIADLVRGQLIHARKAASGYLGEEGDDRIDALLALLAGYTLYRAVDAPLDNAAIQRAIRAIIGG